MTSRSAVRRFGRIILPLLAAGLACTTFFNSPANELEVEQDIVFGPGDFIYTEPRAGLAELASYTASLLVSFEGRRDGNPANWSRNYTMQATNEPHVRQWTIDEMRDTSDPTLRFLAELDGLQYERLGQEACSAVEITEANALSDRLELAGFLSGVIGADAAGSEQINEVQADHFTFDQRALSEDGRTESKGELWVASEGGYLIKYLLTRNAGAEYFGEGIEGILTLEYELTSVNGPPAIALPADCPPGMVDAPLLPDASNVERAAGLLAYDSATGLADAVAFYREQLPGLGWIASGEPLVEEAKALLEFSRGDQIMTVLVSTEPDGTSVNVLLNRAGP